MVLRLGGSALKAAPKDDATEFYRSVVLREYPNAPAIWTVEIKRCADCAFWAMTQIHGKKGPAWIDYRLWLAINDPALMDHPDRVDACLRSMRGEFVLRKYLVMVAAAEQMATWLWEKLTVDERANLGGAEVWRADPEQPSLAGQSFTAWPEIDLPPGFVPDAITRLFRHSHISSLYDGWKKAGVFGERWKKGY